MPTVSRFMVSLCHQHIGLVIQASFGYIVRSGQYGDIAGGWARVSELPVIDVGVPRDLVGSVQHS